MRRLQSENRPERPGDPADRAIGFTLDVLRSADDIPTHQAGIKGAIDCHEQTILRWAMGDRGIVPDDWFGTPPATPMATPAG